MIDIHCHFLPGIDDGPATMQEAIELARTAFADGISCSILTPHIHPGRWENDRMSIQHAVQQFELALNDAGIALELRFAAEVRATDQLFRQLDTGKIPFLGSMDGYRLMLLEFPHGHLIPGADQLARWLLEQKIRPVIAHPERNKAIMRKPEKLLPFLSAGCLLQLTAGSITGNFGQKAQNIALQLLDEDKVTFVASDAHNLKARPPILSAAKKMVTQISGAEVAEALFGGNAQAFLAAGMERD